MRGVRLILLTTVAFLLTHFTAKAQYNLKPLFQIDTSAVFISTDNLDNIYIVTSRNQLLKYNSSGKLLWNYSNKAFGKLSYVNTTDPMRILLFYSAIQQVVVLNNNLNEITRFNFGTDASRIVTLIATANSNGFWIYDQSNRQLQKLSNEFGSELVSGNINQQTQLAIQPSIIQASDQAVYLYDNSLGILQFDRFGNYISTIKTGAISNFQVHGDEVMFLKDSVWNCYKTSSSLIKTLYTFENKPLQVSEGSRLIALLTKEGIKVYTILRNDNEKK